MNDTSGLQAMRTSRPPRRWRWVWIALCGVALLWLILSTEVNFNKPLQAYAKPGTGEEEVFAAFKRHDYETAFPAVAQGAVEGAPAALFIAGDYFRKGLPPVHRDYCSALDAYYAAGIKGDAEAQGRVAEMLLDAPSRA